jgi:hypothetical protein
VCMNHARKCTCMLHMKYTLPCMWHIHAKCVPHTIYNTLHACYIGASCMLHLHCTCTICTLYNVTHVVSAQYMHAVYELHTLHMAHMCTLHMHYLCVTYATHMLHALHMCYICLHIWRMKPPDTVWKRERKGADIKWSDWTCSCTLHTCM